LIGISSSPSASIPGLHPLEVTARTSCAGADVEHQEWVDGISGEPRIWTTRRRELLLAVVIGTGVHALAYFLANHFPRREATELAMTAVDRTVPFLPWTVFLYVSDYVLVILSFLLCRSRESALRFFCAQMSVILFATVLHWAVPIAFPRELYPLPPDLSMPPRLVMTFVRGVDAATSCVPSLHVADSMLAAFMMRRERPKLFPWLMTWAVAIAVSTLTTKQHYLVDVLTGTALALVAAITFQLRPRTHRAADRATTSMSSPHHRAR
jgi:membrane-associated phospholipid phosphatase